MPLTGPPPDKLRQFIDDTRAGIAELERETADNPRLVRELELLRFGLLGLEQLLVEPEPTPEG